MSSFSSLTLYCYLLILRFKFFQNVLKTLRLFQLSPSSGWTSHQPRGPSSSSGSICSNCNTQKTSMWRRDKFGSLVCNACGLYIKLYGINRPINMRKDTIRFVRSTFRQKGKRTRGLSSISFIFSHDCRMKISVSFFLSFLLISFKSNSDHLSH